MGYHTGWKILILRVVVMGKVFTRESSFLGGVKVHTFCGKIFPPRWVIARVGFSLAVGVFSFPGEVLPFSWERVISRYFQR